MHVIVRQHLDQEHRRPVHDHQIPGIAYSHAERLGESVDGACHYRGADGKAGFLRRPRMNGADDLPRPGQPWQRHGSEISLAQS